MQTIFLFGLTSRATPQRNCFTLSGFATQWLSYGGVQGAPVSQST
jgi:hypothetical protein